MNEVIISTLIGLYFGINAWIIIHTNLVEERSNRETFSAFETLIALFLALPLIFKIKLDD